MYSHPISGPSAPGWDRDQLATLTSPHNELAKLGHCPVPPAPLSEGPSCGWHLPGAPWPLPSLKGKGTSESGTPGPSPQCSRLLSWLPGLLLSPQWLHSPAPAKADSSSQTKVPGTGLTPHTVHVSHLGLRPPGHKSVAVGQGRALSKPTMQMARCPGYKRTCSSLCWQWSQVPSCHRDASSRMVTVPPE